MATRPLLLLLLAACTTAPKGDTSGAGSGSGDSAESGDADTAGSDTAESDTADSSETDTSASDTGVDADGDGSAAGEDCNDADAVVHPGATELCNDVDDDCDGEIDEDAGAPWYPDADGDTEGDAAGVFQSCDPPPDGVANSDDCDDTDPERNTLADELCGNAIDDDCDGEIDETCIPSGTLDTSLAQTTYQTDIATDMFGMALTPVPDWTGDGVPEVAFGAPLDNAADVAAGAVYIFDGAATGALYRSHAIGVGNGAAYQFSYGEYLARSPDLDGDGRDELLIGEPGWAWYPGLVAGSGGLAIVTGLAGSGLDQAAEWEFYTEYASGGLGAAGADLDGDGANELLVGAYTFGYPKTENGRVYVIPSADVLVGGDIEASATTLDGPEGSLAGYGITNIGDLDGDGDDEVFIGSGGWATSCAWVLDGRPTGGALTDWTVTTFTGETRDYAGFVASAPGDFDGDGRVDLVVTAPWDDTAGENAGAVFVFDGATRGDTPLTDARLVLTAEAAGAFAGSSVSTAGDLDLDGREDLLVGAKWEDAYAGRAYVVVGAPTGTLSLGASWITFEPVTTEQLGFKVDGTTDFSGDGVSEVFLSSHPVRGGASTVFRWTPAGG